ncbi:MAG TPA: helix-turn-helix transcriptional regulator [Actinomycetota bacterium]|nr:helix-turn-helix transcriptional regulator [Actinomycetota bacterium]
MPGDAEPRGRNSRPSMWLLVDPRAVPPGMATRAVPMALIALLPGEVDAFDGATGADPEEVAVARLAARGLPATEIAARLHISRRTAYRRLARLREAVGARSSAELAARLSERGF